MIRLLKLTFIALASSATLACAAGFPEKPVRVIVPFPPGGGTDAFARIVGAKLTEYWGQQVIVDNRAGAQGNIGTALGARAAPDGYTITIAHQGALTINPFLYSNPGFDTLRDFTAISRGTATAPLLVVHPSVPAKTLKELVQVAKRNPGKLNFASTSSGQQLRGELFKMTTGTDMTHIPYKGAGPAVIDLLAGNITLMFSNPTSVVPHVKVGKLRAIAVMGDKPLDALPGVPSAVDAGYPQLNVLEWYGWVAPSATPRDIVTKLNEDIVRALKSPEVLGRLTALGQGVETSTPEQFAEHIRKEYERWGKVVKASGAKVE